MTPGRVGDTPRLRESRRQRLLQDDVLAVGEREARGLGMQVVRQQDVHDVDVIARNNVLVAVAPVGDPPTAGPSGAPGPPSTEPPT
jgi:hypothetical protein